MVEIYPMDPDKVRSEMSLGTVLRPRSSIINDPFEADKQYGFFDAFGAAFLRENTVLSAIRAATGAADSAVNVRTDPNFNPYSYLKESRDEQTLALLAPFISDGEFEGALNEETTKAITEELLYEIELQQKMEGSVLGSLAGSLVTGLVDPTSYIPFFGQMARAGRMGRVGLVALNAALSAGVSETVLQATQRTRTLEESLMNIGSSAVLGGGLGIFAGGRVRSNTIHPKNLNNPTRIENLRSHGQVVEARGVRDHITAEELDDARSLVSSTLGAAQAHDLAGAKLARSDPKTAIGRAVRKVGDFFNSPTIAGRNIRATSDVARLLGIKLMDHGAILTTAHVRGEAPHPSAEAIKADYMSEVEKLSANLETSVAKLNQEIGKGGRFQRGKVQRAELMQLTQRRLFGMEDPDLEKALADKHGGTALDAMRRYADQNAEDIHALNDVWEGRLIKEGLLQDKAKVSKLQSELDALKAEVQKLTDAHSVSGDGSLKGDLDKARQNRETVRNELRKEKAKAEPLGRKYGHAQMWNAEAAMSNPDAFRAFLMDVLALKPDDDWLLTYHDMSPDELDQLKVDDKAAWQEIMESWTGDAYYFQISRREAELGAAETALKDANLDLMEAARAANVADRDEISLSLKEIGARRNKLMSDIETGRAHKAQLEADIRSFKEAATAARDMGLDRLRRDGPTEAEVKRDRQIVIEQQKQNKLQSAIDDALTDPATPKDAAGQPRFQDAGDVAKQTEGVAKGGRKLRQRDRDANTTTEGMSLGTARQEGRAQEAARQLAMETSRLERLEYRAARLDEKLHDAQVALEKQKLIKEKLNQDVARAREDRKIAAKDAKAVKRALLKDRKAPGLDQTVRDIQKAITTQGALPSGIMDRIAEHSDRVTGRVKERVLVLNNEQRLEAMKQGWLHDDLDGILYNQYNQLASELALREGVGYGPNRQFANWDEAMKLLDDDYEGLISEAGGAQSKLGAKLSKEWRIQKDDLLMARDRLKGGFDDDGTTFGWLKWGSEKFRQMNYIRFGGGFLLSSLTDTATVSLRHGGLVKMLTRYGPTTIRMMREFYEHDPVGFKAMVHATEYATNAAAVAKRSGSEDLIHGPNRKHGVGYGTTRKVTGAIDRGAEKMSEIVTQFSGLPLWNRFWKIASSLSMSDKLHRMVGDYDNLKPSEIADLASLGIGKAQANRMRKYLEEFSTKDENGMFDPHFEKWGDTEDGLAAARDFRIAIRRDMDRAINTPGIGDTPRLMSKWYGRTLFQFQTFAFTFLNRFAYPMVQRMSLFKERQAFAALGMLMTSATFVLIGKDVINGRDPMERLKEENLRGTLYEIVDRSGLLGHTSPYADSVLKLASPWVGSTTASRYARNGALESLLGVNMALISDIGKFATSAAAGEPDVLDKLMVLAPFSTQARMFQHLALDK